MPIIIKIKHIKYFFNVFFVKICLMINGGLDELIIVNLTILIHI